MKIKSQPSLERSFMELCGTDKNMRPDSSRMPSTEKETIQVIDLASRSE